MRAEQKCGNIDALVTINKEQLFKKKQNWGEDLQLMHWRLETLLQQLRQHEDWQTERP